MRPVVLLAVVALLVSLTPSVASAAPQAPDAYAYLDDPRMTGEGQEPPHAELRPYAGTRDAARHGERTPYTRSLDGDWRIRMADHPDDVPDGFFADGYDVGDWPVTTVPHTWQTAGLDHPMFRNIAEEMWPDDPPHAPKDVNPTGAYVREFDVPANWRDRSTFLRFEGVTSGYFVWVNGTYAGYDQGGYTPAEFDISEQLRPGRNRVAVQVHRWGSGSYLEDVDQWRYSGIFRSVWLYSTPRTHIRDLTVTTDLDDTFTDATLTADVALTRDSTGPLTVRGSLRDEAGHEVARTETTTEGNNATLSTVVHQPRRWTDETPNLYTLVLTAGEHVTSERVGFREITVEDRQLKVNGKRVLFKGVNRAETDPDHGRHVPRAHMERDVALMQRLHVNAVRTAHYPSDPYFYDLADREGLWIDDEVDIETHSHESCPDNCLADRPEWQDAFHDRFVAMVARDKNHPSVFMWDTGNEAGLGQAHHAMADWARANEPTRPLYHQSNSPDGDAPYADVWGPRYPSPERLAEQAAETTKPVILGEYAHAMGNSLGNFREFWDLIRAHPQLQGGFIWDWAEQNIRQDVRVTPDGSGNDIMAHLIGQPSIVDGHRGKALALSGLDDFVEVYRDRRLEIRDALTLDAWVRPADWTGDLTMIAKGDHAYALKMKTENTLEFFIHSGGWRTVQARVPADFYHNWHRVTGTYDGATLRLYVDGREVGATTFAGPIDNTFYEVNVGRNPEVMQDQYNGRMAHGVLDDVRIYDHALPAETLAAGGDPAAEAVLALDFDRFDTVGTHLSYGESVSGVDGLVGADRYLQPETAQLGWVQQPLRLSYADGVLTVHNERSFASTAGTRLRWSVVEGRRVVARGERALDVAPGGSASVRIPVPGNPDDVERFLNVATAGAVAAHDQFPLGGSVIPGNRPPDGSGPVAVEDDAAAVTLSGKDFRYTLDKSAGTLASMRVRGTELLYTGPELDAWRAPNSNETYSWGTAEGELWRAAGLDRLETTVESVEVTAPGTVTVTSTVAAPDRPEASFAQTMTYRVDGAGTIRLAHHVSPRGAVRELPYLPRIGVTLAVPDTFDRFAWYGRGEQESYVDRADGTPVGVYGSTVDEQYVDYHRPQDHGNHTDTRWALLTDGRTGGLLVAGANDVSVTPYDDLDRAAYPFELRRNPGWLTLHADKAATGVGDTPNPVREHYQVQQDTDHDYELVIRPLGPDELAG
ncbi:MAG: glycoside hydrolase family 2 TIM barrel-domain containing protein [Actinophytocola sp.]|uniref:glycoside hydrolase family 2 TIM barrel-domain containing protein n=1 Tax=Actinophytocola sp. TaxID=1872138 RepID=UPI003D6C079E